MTVFAFIPAWLLVERDLGRHPTVEEYADWWGDVSYATAYRQQATFRDALPMFDSPTEWAAVAVNVQDPVPTRYRAALA